jgi:hypothetical protein
MSGGPNLRIRRTAAHAIARPAVAPAPRRARQQQPGDVGASDDQQQAGRAEQEQQGAARRGY